MDPAGAYQREPITPKTPRDSYGACHDDIPARSSDGAPAEPLESFGGSVRYFQVETFRHTTLCFTNVIFYAVLVTLVVVSFSSSIIQFECRNFCSMGHIEQEGPGATSPSDGNGDPLGLVRTCSIGDPFLSSDSYEDVAACITDPLSATSIVSGGVGVPDGFLSQLTGFQRFTVVVGANVTNKTIAPQRPANHTAHRNASAYQIWWRQDFYALNPTTPNVVFLGRNGEVLQVVSRNDVYSYEPRVRAQWATDASVVTVYELPGSLVGKYHPGIHHVALDFGADPMVRLGKTPLPVMNENVTVQPVVSVRFFQRDEKFVQFEIAYRFIVFFFGIGVLVAFMNGWTQDTGGIISGIRQVGIVQFIVILLKRSMSLPFQLKATMMFHLVVTISSDPLYAAFVTNSHKVGWYVWNADILYLTIVVAMFYFFTYIIISLGNIGELHKQRIRFRVAAPATFMAVAFTAAELSSSRLRQKHTTGKPTGLFAQSITGALFNLIIVMVWTLGILLYFWRRRRQQVWKKGVPLYHGTTRIFVLWLRMVSMHAVAVLIAWVGFITPGTTISSWLVPMYDLNNTIEITLFMMFSVLCMYLFYPREESSAVFPPNPNIVRRGAALQLSPDSFADDGTDAQILGIRHADGAGDSATPLSVARLDLGGAASGRSSVFPSRSMRAFDETLMVGSPRGGAAAASDEGVVGAYSSRNSSSNQVPVAAAATPKHWSQFKWTEKHFETLRHYKLSGFYFLTEQQKLRFDAANANVKGFRSFFCWETAASALNMANEVYNRADQTTSDMIFVEHERGCFENCVGNCCLPGSEDRGCCGAMTSSRGTGANDFIDGVDADEESQFAAEARARQAATNPTDLSAPRPSQMDNDRPIPVRTTTPTPTASNPGSPSASETAANSGSPALPTLKVDLHGYQLHKVLIAHGIQVVIAWMNEQPACGAVTTASTQRVAHICISFRGTSNAKNAVTDVDFGRTVWDEMITATKGAAKIHSGFGTAWRDLQSPVAEHLSTLISRAVVPLNAPILINGHSLGGACAGLCTYSLKAGKLQHLGADRPLLCYTLGMPRVGNESFCRQFDLLCPETYRIVNESDKVALITHCARLHVGHLVVLDRDGNFIVEPNILESGFELLNGAGSSLRNHLLERYANSFDNACRAIRVDRLKLFCTFRSAVRIPDNVPVLDMPPPRTPATPATPNAIDAKDESP